MNNDNYENYQYFLENLKIILAMDEELLGEYDAFGRSQEQITLPEISKQGGEQEAKGRDQTCTTTA
jgi:hypothetical protein